MMFGTFSNSVTIIVLPNLQLIFSVLQIVEHGHLLYANLTSTTNNTVQCAIAPIRDDNQLH
jgi:hypothetical protein